MGSECVVNYTLTDVRRRVWLALQQLFLQDSYLVDGGHWEGALSHRLAVYLEHQFPGWHVDCEFNKVGDDPKLASTQKESKRPDIIVHQRGEAGPNLLAVEIKKKDRIDRNDCTKAERYIGEIGYTWAVCISVHGKKAQCEWHGPAISRESSLDELIWANLEDIGHGG